jgi:hypothetical protein
VPAAKYPPSTPEKSVAKATAAHRAGAEPGVPRAERTQRDEPCPDGSQAEVGEQPHSPPAAELDQHEHRERAEGREDRRLRLPDHLVREREDRRHHDRGARGGLQRCEIRHEWRS